MPRAVPLALLAAALAAVAPIAAAFALAPVLARLDPSEDVAVIDAGGWQSSPARVTLDLEQPSLARAVVCWTEGDAEPSLAGPCVEPGTVLTVASATRIRARAFDAAGHAGPVATADVLVDDAPPDTLPLGVDATGWRNAPVVLEVGPANGTDDGSGVARIEYRVNRTTGLSFGALQWSGWHAWRPAGRIAIAPPPRYVYLDDVGTNLPPFGVTRIEVRAVDRVGNADPTPVALTFRFDSDGPDFAWTRSPDDEWTRENVTVDVLPVHDALAPWISSQEVSQAVLCARASGEESSCWLVDINDDTFSPAPTRLCPLDGGACVSSLAQVYEEGTIVDVRAYDEAGNVATARIVVPIDRTAPALAVNVPASPRNTNAVLAVDATDTLSGVERVEATLDRGATWIAVPDGGLAITDEGVTETALRALDRAGNVALAGPYATLVDRTSPEASLALDPATEWAKGTVRVALGASADATGTRVCFTLDGSEPTRAACASAGSTLFLAEEGSTTVRARAVDDAGNFNGTIAETIARVDRGAPVVTALVDGSPPPAGWLGEPATVTLDASDALSGVQFLRYGLDGNETSTAYTGAILLAGEGERRVRYRALDRAGNDAEGEVTVRLDTIAPASEARVDGTAAEDGSWRRTPFEVAFAATDPEPSSGLAPLESVVIASEGLHAIEWAARDVAGNVEPTRRIALGLDATPPTVAPLVNGATPGSEWLDGPATVDLAPVDGLSGIAVARYSTDGSEPSIDYEGPFSVAGEGLHHVRYHVVDAAGNAIGGELTVRLDTIAPASEARVNGAAITNGTWRRSPFRVTFLASDPEPSSGVEAIPDVAFDVEERRAISWRARDLAGNEEALREITLGLDATPPEVAPRVNGAVPSSGWIAEPASVDLSPADALSGVAETLVSVDGSAPSLPYASPITLATDGDHLVRFRVTDRAGNVLEGSFHVRIDRVAPASEARVDGEPAVNASWRRAPFEVTFEASDAAPSSGLADLAPVRAEVEGFHAIRWSARDLAGNEEPPREIVLGLDATPPRTVARAEPVANEWGWRNATTRLTLDASDALSGAAGTWLDVGDGPRAAGAGAVLARDGAHVARYWSVDAAGNEENAAEFAILVDATPPVIDVNASLAAGAWTRGSLAIPIAASDATSGVAERAYRVLASNGTLLDEGRLENAELLVELAEDARVEAAAVDFAGNRASWALVARALVDVTGPEVALLDAPDVVRPGAIRLRGEAADAGVGLASLVATLDDAPALVEVAADGTFALDAHVTEGRHVLALAAQDALGNEASLELILLADGSPPVLRELPGTVSVEVGVLLEFPVIVVEDATSVEASWTFHDGTNASGLVVARRYPTPGTFEATVRVVDAVGNAPVAHVFTVQVLRPHVPEPPAPAPSPPTPAPAPPPAAVAPSPPPRAEAPATPTPPAPATPAEPARSPETRPDASAPPPPRATIPPSPEALPPSEGAEGARDAGPGDASLAEDATPWAIPAPGALALLVASGLLAVPRRRRARSRIREGDTSLGSERR